MIDKSKGIVECDFCEKEDRLIGNVKLEAYTFMSYLSKEYRCWRLIAE